MQWRKLREPGSIGLAVLGVLAVVLAVLAVQKQNAPPPDVAPAAPAGPSLAVIGDSFASGTPDGGLGRTNWAEALGARNGWTVTNAAADGAGYVAAPPDGGSFATQVPRVVAAVPDVVVVLGARPDVSAAPDDVRAAADALYRDLTTSLPQSRIVVIGPIWPGEEAPEEIRRVRDSVRDAAEAARVPFLDPIRDEWFLADDDPGLTPDRQHLNDRGHQGMVDLVGEGLRRIPALPG